MNNIENTILSSLINHEEYTRKVLPFIQEEYFQSPSDKLLFSIIESYIDKYNVLPDKKVLHIELENFSIGENLYKEVDDKIDKLQSVSTKELDWLIDKTEDFCKDKALYNALMKSVQIVNDEDNKEQISRSAIPELLKDAVSVSFDTAIGHNYFEDSETRFDGYISKEEKIPFHIDLLNTITNGGPPRKTLNIILGGTGGGKTLSLCDIAVGNLKDGFNVLYVTLEMSEQKIAQRIDANLLDERITDLEDMPKSLYVNRIQKAKGRTKGRLIIKEYPTASANVNHFRALIRELRLKQNFIPDVIIIDYLNISASARFKNGANVNSYMYVKSIAEELRGLAVETNTVLWSATQTTRGGFGNSDVELTDTSESFGLPATADLMLAIIATEELDAIGQVMFKQLKNRYNDLSYYRKFYVGIDRSRMKLFNIDQEPIEGLKPEKNKAVFDDTPFGGGLSNEAKEKIRNLDVS